MNLKELWMRLWHTEIPADPLKVRLTERQLTVAGRLAKMKGTTRDEVLREAYRRADNILRQRR
jgi:uncharacterized protein (DUF1778 family)